MPSTTPCIVTAFLALGALNGRAAQHEVTSAAEIEHAAALAQPGDVLVMRDGEWRDQVLHFRGHGTTDKPITLRAATPGKVSLVGKSSLMIDGEHLEVSGLFLKYGEGTADGVKLAGNHCRLTETGITGGNYKFLVHLFGRSNRVDHCYLAGKTNGDPTLQVEVEGRPNFHRIDRNHFGPRPPLGRNGGETIRVGYSHQSMTNSSTLVESNLFERCDGELEIISSKSCENIYRANTFADCAGTLTLRHGNRCLVDGNFFLGHHKKGSGGIRVIGEEHIIVNNYIEGVTQGGVWITAGIPNSELKGYFQARNCVIAFNTIVDSAGPCLQLDAGMGSSGRTLLPENITVANNLFAPGQDGTLFRGREGRGWKWFGNVAGGSSLEHSGLRLADVKLARAPDGMLRPAPDSPVLGAAEGTIPWAAVDMDGQDRPARADSGSDQVSNGPTTRAPLTSAEVGPSWLDRRPIRP
jgi:poly(beta-D-mannuronate) lyase